MYTLLNTQNAINKKECEAVNCMAGNCKVLYFNGTIITAGGTITKDAIVHAAQQGSFITHYTVIITD